jgi:hypothetical protein
VRAGVENLVKALHWKRNERHPTVAGCVYELLTFEDDILRAFNRLFFPVALAIQSS